MSRHAQRCYNQGTDAQCRLRLAPSPPSPLDFFFNLMLFFFHCIQQDNVAMVVVDAVSPFFSKYSGFQFLVDTRLSLCSV